ncbi:pectate lyase [Maribacter confluentis]|uniref:Pectinesterase n=1 Tax=Maribacter confluentis TaxID=1656093 RepID=A0ABT8RSZ1_9FLAO|nr:pectate lyase [Maribacter confluentis]MDO1513835.1 pectate lyase [Maribacter confluentis]
MVRNIVLFMLILIAGTTVHGQVLDHSWGELVNSNEPNLYASPEILEVADNVLLLQKEIGGWPKNKQPQNITAKEKVQLHIDKNDNVGATIDNGATTLEMIFLAKVYAHHNHERYRIAFIKGLEYLIQAQYENGGWPQFYPLRKGYYTHITYNDDAMVNVMNLLRDIYETQKYDHLNISAALKNAAKNAFDKGVQCILKTQYKQNGVLTAWCAQHDVETYAPAKARAYELPSLSGKESAKIVLLLMSIKNPSEEIINSVTAASNWFKKAQITDTRVERIYNSDGKVIDKKVIAEHNVKPIWGRFMNLDDNRAFFCDRDGIKKYSLSEIGDERRNGYRWYTDEPQEVLDEFSQWQKNVTIKRTKVNKIDIYNMTVAKDGSGDFFDLQSAINAAKGFPDKSVTILLKNGIYNEKVKVYEWNTNMRIIGESTENTIITFDDHFNKINLGRNSTFHTPTFSIEGNDFYLTNVTLKNTAGEVGQAIALAVHANRVKIENCRIMGNQDTVYVTGEGYVQYFKNCYIEGTTDFIFGQATAFFEDCIIHSKKNSYITAASTPKGIAYGFVFKNCRLTAPKEVTQVYLGRPWRTHAKTVFLNCEMGSHIVPKGWDNWSNKEAEEQSFYAEYNNTGPGYIPKQRVEWSYQLGPNMIKEYERKTILGNSLWFQID